MVDSPFGKRYGNSLEVDDVRQIFYNDADFKINVADKLCEQKNTIIWGFRGTGKTMLLRYFDMDVQVKILDGFRNYTEKSGFLGIHLNFISGGFDIPNLDIEIYSGIEDAPFLFKNMAYAISEDLIVTAMIESLIKKLAEHAKDSELYMDLSSKYGANHLIGKKLSMSEALTCFHMGDIKAFNKLDNYFTFEYTFKPVAEKIKRHFGGKPIYLLMDNFKYLHIYQQKLINTWMGKRDNDLICFKIAVEPFEYKTFGTLSDMGRILQKGYDYNEIHLNFDMLFKGEESEQKRREFYTGIADNRIKQYFDGMGYVPEKHSVEKLLPGQGGKKSVYSGIDDVIALSFGNIREFLKLCDCLLGDAFRTGQINSVSHEDQNDKIRTCSERFIEGVKSLGNIVESPDINKKLINLIKNIIQLIMVKAKEEKKYDGFTVQDQHGLCDKAKEVLRWGIDRQFLRKVSFRTDDGILQDLFIVNKLIFPKMAEDFLDVHGEGVRFIFSCKDFQRAVTEEKDVFIQADERAGDKGIMTLTGITEEEPEYEYGRLY